MHSPCVAALASMVTAPLRRAVPGSKLEELGALAATFNNMAARLKKSFDDLVGVVETRKIRERELQESEAPSAHERGAMALDIRDLDAGIMLADHDHRLLNTNGAMQAMLGYSAQELQGLSPVDLMAEEERKSAHHRLAELSEGKRRNYETVTNYRRRDGFPYLGQHIHLDHSEGRTNRRSFFDGRRSTIFLSLHYYPRELRDIAVSANLRRVRSMVGSNHARQKKSLCYSLSG